MAAFVSALVSVFYKKPLESAPKIEFSLRSAVIEDVRAIYQLSCANREFHNCDPKAISEENIRKYCFGATPLCKIELAEVDQKVVGMAVYYFVFASFAGAPEIKVEEVFVMPEYRKTGIGTALAKKIVGYAIENKDCKRISGEVAKRNSDALSLYESFGAEILDKLTIVRLPRKAMEKLGNQ
jgi:GNAT superfamily N-acetyltransferase